MCTRVAVLCSEASRPINKKIKILNIMDILFIGQIGPWQVVLIAVIVLIFFGGSKLPGLMRGAGKGIKEFKDAINGKDTENPRGSVEAKEVKDDEEKGSEQK